MRIAPRIISIFLPLFLVPMIFLTFAATATARKAISAVATDFLQFKAAELDRFAASQYNLLNQNGLSDNPEYIAAAKRAVAEYAGGLVQAPTQLIFAMDASGNIAFSTSSLELSENEGENIRGLSGTDSANLVNLTLGDQQRVGVVRSFAPFDWTILITDRTSSFFRFIDQITVESVVISGVALIAVVILTIVFARLLTTPLHQIVNAMQGIVETGDLGRRVNVPYADEVGMLGDSFNAMTGALENAYSDIKNYALQAAIAQRRESKIRNVFQKYVPKHVIDEFFVSPDSMLVGQSRTLAILFSDIRGFTTLSEHLSPHEIVESLNQYFGRVVDVIMKNRGLVDKYIGDAVMAFFGAPAEDTQSCLHSVLAAFDMLDQLEEFNQWQTEHDRSPVHIGIGINYGPVTIGNIGSEQKMDYTVVGDMVNVASRLEGLTRYYDQPLLVSESVRRRLHPGIPCRFIDRVQVKGRSGGLAVYTARRELTEAETSAWKLHEEAIVHYYDRDFARAARGFEQVIDVLPDDPIALFFLQRCKQYLVEAPPDNWTGVVTYTEK